MYNRGFPKAKEYAPRMVVAYVRKNINGKQELKKHIGWINIEGVVVRSPFLTPEGEAQTNPTAEYNLTFCYFDYLNLDTFNYAGTVGNMAITGYGVTKASDFYVIGEATEEEIKESFNIWEGQENAI